MTFTTDEQTIVWEYLVAYLRYTDFLLKTAYFKHFVHFTAIEKFEKLNFAANYRECV